MMLPSQHFHVVFAALRAPRVNSTHSYNSIRRSLTMRTARSRDWVT